MTSLDQFEETPSLPCDNEMVVRILQNMKSLFDHIIRMLHFRNKMLQAYYIKLLVSIWEYSIHLNMQRSPHLYKS
jgi:hypothetical protein